MNYLIHDCETTIKQSYKRTANPFDEENWVVANGFKRPNEEVFCDYFTEPSKQSLPIKESDEILVGFNYKFDLLWHWHLPELTAFFKRGGRVWCCQYAEYLLEGQDTASQMCSMDSIVERYGGKLKIDEVKAMWKAGINTPDIPKDLLLKYLGGTDGDINNTEKIYLAQVLRAKEQGQYNDIMQRMEGLLCTTMMEYNGLYINQKQAYEDKAMLEGELKVLEEVLKESLPAMPEGLEFNWGSSTHKSCLIFGGSIKYQKWKQHEDEEGNPLYAMRDEVWVLAGGKPAMTLEDFTEYTHNKGHLSHGSWLEEIDRNKSGKAKGEVKTKIVKVPDADKPKGAQTDFFFTLPRITEPSPEWKGKNTDYFDEPLYSTGKDVIEELGTRGIPFLSAMANRSKLMKDIGTYYITEENGVQKGMLTCVNEKSVIHHKLNHTISVTTRLSSSDPNLQNLTRPDFDAALGRAKSVVKRMFSSRFGDDGEMTEADYAQLEVVVQGLLTNDKQLKLDLLAGVDFHCKRLSAKEGISYEEVVDLCKVQELIEWKLKRTKTKEFTFQRAFGAALKSIAAKTGMSLEDVQKLSDAEELLYPGITRFYDSVEEVVKSTRVPTTKQEPYPDKPEVYITVGKGYYQSITNARFVFYEKPSPKFLRAKGIMTSIYRPHIQNYPIQGVAAQVVQYILGLLFRHYIRNDNYNGRAYLVNTVHDCVWSDHRKEVREDVREDLRRIMQLVPQVLKKLHGIDTELKFPVSVETGPNMMEMH